MHPAYASTISTPRVETFSTGATRESDLGKLDYEGFISPRAFHTFSTYMHKHRLQADGTLRASDNWQKGIPTERYRKSLVRHLIEYWYTYRGGSLDDRSERDPQNEEEMLCAILFNVQGLLHEGVK